MDYADMTVPAKHLSVQVHNFNYDRTMAAPAPQIAELKSPSPSLQTVEGKLRDPKALLDQGLITQSDYDAKKAQILQGM